MSSPTDVIVLKAYSIIVSHLNGTENKRTGLSFRKKYKFKRKPKNPISKKSLHISK